MRSKYLVPLLLLICSSKRIGNAEKRIWYWAEKSKGKGKTGIVQLRYIVDIHVIDALFAC